MTRHARIALLLAFVLAPALAAQPKAPSVLVDGAEFSISWKNGIQLPDGWWRVDSVIITGEVVAQGFASSTHLLVDVFNVGSESRYIAFNVEQDGDEYARTVPPWCGIGWSSDCPYRELIASGQYDGEYDPRTPWGKVDLGYTLQTGSARNRFFSGHQWRAEHDGVSPAMAAWLDRWVRWQLQRSYQMPDPSRALPRPFLGLSPVGGGWETYLEAGTVTPSDTHHHTIGVLLDAYLLTGNPRALDQAVRLERWIVSTADYYDPEWPWPYGGSERVLGWLLVSLADYGQLALAAGLDSEFTWAALRAQEHLETAARVGFNELGLPNIAAPPDGRHLKVWHNLPWQGAIVAFGMLRCREVFGTPGMGAEAEKWLQYIENHGWDGLTTVYDSIPHNLSDQGVLPKGAGIPGIGLWAAPPFILSEKNSSPLLLFIKGKAESIKVYGQPMLSPNGGHLGIFGPIIEG